MKSRGFTLIELMITLVVLAVLLYVALPNFAVWMQNTQIRTAGEAILNGMQLARTEAIRRNVDVEMQMDLSSGWTARVAGPGGEVIQSRLHGEGSGAALVTIAPVGAKTVTFTSFGSVKDKNLDGTDRITEIKIDSPAISAADSRELCILVRTGGNVRLCDPQVFAPDTRTCGGPPAPAGCS